MSAYRRRRSLWHLKSSLSILLVGLSLALVLGGCPRAETPEESPEGDAAPKTGAEIRRVVNALYKQKGEDAYTDPTLDPLLVQLEVLARGGDKDAATLRALILAKRRLALRAQSGRRGPPPVNRVLRGKMEMTGDPPESTLDLERAEAVRVGSSRQELRDAYGSCLIRQTWFPATRPGGITTELFHVAPSCREKLTPRVFRVATGKVLQVEDGDLDGVMEEVKTPQNEDGSAAGPQ